MSMLDLDRRIHSGRPGARPPGGRVTVDAGDPVADAALGVVSIRARMVGGRGPVRLYLYVDGDLTQAWTEAEGHFDLSLDEYGPGRHVVTARGIDAFGRWTGASIVVGCHGMEPARNE